MSNLTVYWDQQIVGTISRHPKDKITFQYAAEWLKNSGQQISLSLPCQEERFSPGVSTAFFENLFPESDARTILAQGKFILSSMLLYFRHRFIGKFIAT